VVQIYLSYLEQREFILVGGKRALSQAKVKIAWLFNPIGLARQ